MVDVDGVGPRTPNEPGLSPLRRAAVLLLALAIAIAHRFKEPGVPADTSCSTKSG
jgi:hypothetical protein